MRPQLWLEDGRHKLIGERGRRRKMIMSGVRSSVREGESE
jgi:hypothetical protein